MEKMEQEAYDVIVADYQMPGKDGLEFLKELREKGNDTPFMIFTGKGREEVAIKALNLGADGYILKPFDIEKLLEMIKKHLTKKTAEHISNWMEFDHDTTRKSRFDLNNVKRKGSLLEQQ